MATTSRFFPSLKRFARGLVLSIAFVLAIKTIDRLVGPNLHGALPSETVLAWVLLMPTAAAIYALLARYLPQPAPAFRPTGPGLATGAACLTFYAAAMTVALHVAGDGYLRVSSPPHLLQPNYLAMALCAAMTEELLFRGLLLRSCLVVMPMLAAVALQATAFAFVHLTNDGTNLSHLGGHLLTGVLFGRLALMTRSTAPATVLHAGMNVFSCSLINSPTFGGWGVAAGFRIDYAGFITADTLSNIRLACIALLLCSIEIVAYGLRKRAASHAAEQERFTAVSAPILSR